MEEKLNMIFEKLLDIEISIKEKEYKNELYKLEYERKELNNKIDDFKYIREKEFERRAEMMDIFRGAGNEYSR